QRRVAALGAVAPRAAQCAGSHPDHHGPAVRQSDRRRDRGRERVRPAGPRAADPAIDLQPRHPGGRELRDADGDHRDRAQLSRRHRLRRDRPAAASARRMRPRSRASVGLWLGAALAAVLLAATAISLVWTPYPPAAIDIPHKLAPPSLAHWFGTDTLGRDVASQLLAGSRVSILVGVVAVGIGLVFGVSLGLFASLSKGFVEDAIMKACDFVFAFPALLSAIMLTSTYG